MMAVRLLPPQHPRSCSCPPSSARKRRSDVSGPSALFTWLVLILTSITALQAHASPQIEIEGLMPNTAILLIDGERKMLKVGQSHNGVTLIESYSRTATLEVDGKQMIMGLSRRVGAVYKQPTTQSVKIQRDTQLQYRTTAEINGRRHQVLVDTGANIVALSSKHAQLMGIDLKGASPGRVSAVSSPAVSAAV